MSISSKDDNEKKKKLLDGFYRRLKVLSMPKKDFSKEECDNSKCKKHTTSAPAVLMPNRSSNSARLEELSKPRGLSKHYVHNRYDYYILDDGYGSRIPEASDRISTLSMPLARESSILLESPQRPVSEAALSFSCTPRLESLARAKPIYAGYQPNKPVVQPIPKKVLTARCDERIVKLSRPKSFAASVNTQKEEPFTVLRSALTAKCSARVLELHTNVPDRYLPMK